MKIKIYQINSDRDKNRVKFEGLESTKQYQGNSQIDSSIYDEVFSGNVDSETLEDVYRQFNTEGHPLHRGHSLSVSDIIVNEDGAFFCDSIGFSKVDFDPTKTQKSDNLLTVVYVEPNKAPYVSEVADDLHRLQKAVGGLIEIVYNEDGTILVCNDEAKLIGMEGNRRISDGSSIIAGPFFVVGDNGENFRSLTQDEITKYMDRFAEPEQISAEEVEADTGFTFISGI